MEKNVYPIQSRKRKGRERGYERTRDNRPDRRRKRKAFTKAEMRRRTRALLANAIKEVMIFNRIDILPDKKAHLEKALEYLETVLEQKGGSHLIRQQHALCRDKLRDLGRGVGDVRHEQVKIVVDADF